MRFNILIGGKAGQGINKVSEIISKILSEYGYFTFGYRDYQSMIRGGHNFNIICFSDEWVASHESKIDFLIALDDNTLKEHKDKLKKDSVILKYNEFESLGKNLNIALAGSLVKILGIEKHALIKEIGKEFNKESVDAAEKGFDSQKERIHLEKIDRKIRILNGSKAAAIGAINSNLDLLIAYPMTPATGLINELANFEAEKKKLVVFQTESEVAGINQALGASFSGAVAMTGTSGGGFDLMTEGLSFAGQAEIPIVIYLASRPGPSTGIPTYTSQDDLNVALRAGHGDFPRVVVAPGDALECEEKTNEAFYLSYGYNIPSIILTDKHLAESEFSNDKKINKILSVKINRKIPGKEIVKASSYEHDSFGNTTESGEIAKRNAESRVKKYEKIKKEIEKLEPIKLYGNKNSKNLVISFGSTKGAILNAISQENLDCGFLQVIYLKPLSGRIKKLMEKSKNLILVEQNVTGQLGRLLREKTGISIKEKNRILKYDGRPFTSDELAKEIRRRLR